ncbi:MAG: hypothetical protein LAT51_10225 [Flavobacteriaceae bacterium]|nr:hypothetical protein [Flavobacteriaceae bacterium]
MNLQERYQSKTPKFFRKLRNIGLGITAGAGALLSAPISLPAGIITAVGYLAVAGTTVSAVSQAVIKDEEEECEKLPENNQRPTRSRSESDENTS